MQGIEEPISYFRQQDIATACLDLMDAQISMLRGNRAEALVSLRKTAGKLYRWPLDSDPVFESLRDNPEFLEILRIDSRDRNEQLELLRKLHEIPPTWSPDNQAGQ